MKKGTLTFKFPANIDETRSMSLVLFTPDGGDYNFVFNNVDPVIELKDEEGNDITDDIKNIDKFDWFRDTGWENGKYFDELDPEGLEENYDTDEENRVASIKRKEMLVKAVHCDLSHIFDKPMSQTWKRLADNEIAGGRFLHELFAANVVENNSSDEEPEVFSWLCQSDDVEYAISYNIEWEGDFDIEKLVFVSGGSEEFNIEALNSDVVGDELVLISFIVYDGKMFQSQVELYYEGEERSFGEIGDEIGGYEFNSWNEPITKSEIESDGE